MTLGIVAALHEEIAQLLGEMAPGAHVERIGMRDYHVGRLHGEDCVVVLARLGKVAAAATATALIHQFGVKEIVFTGVAGGLAHGLAIGDVVVADALLQHDLDARPFFPLHEVPLLGQARFATHPALRENLAEAARRYLQTEMAAQVPGDVRAAFGLTVPRVHLGLIASGDQFIGSAARLDELRAALPDALAVEMEGAALAQVCFEYDVPCAVLRTLSDSADDHAHADFPLFLRAVASAYSHGIIRHFLALRHR
ncbi:5'-methylthioadenosine/S-adenosylhomocysteine nucleosidase [Pandoraea terrae]|uniref:5'-methylthioadenosine/S-adenosylhomocysteine nucleosidase n=1 Tax=Pandoraea terrae TaxID=1537710 RepID=A0A5E4U0J2_9BURK|nr:5'-methylthioadenosine/adenosylhomocysteine nucleosidase [Pandoraea terrae]VVD93676.1 5'-methylthioadenosine/S-adenosylhomocysteine nucleosidase [Pandoraea terrae]